MLCIAFWIKRVSVYFVETALVFHPVYTLHIVMSKTLGWFLPHISVLSRPFESWRMVWNAYQRFSWSFFLIEVLSSININCSVCVKLQNIISSILLFCYIPPLLLLSVRWVANNKAVKQDKFSVYILCFPSRRDSWPTSPDIQCFENYYCIWHFNHHCCAYWMFSVKN